MTLSTLLFSTLFACGEKTEVTTTAAESTEEATPVAEKEERINIEEMEHFGSEFTLDSAVPAAAVLSNPDQYVGQTVRVTGKVSDVCQAMGCWMVITDADQHMRITTKDHKFFVAKDGAGALCDLEGTVVKREANPERTEHYKSEQSEGAPMPEAELQGKATYEIVASAIQFDRSNLNTPAPSAAE